MKAHRTCASCVFCAEKTERGGYCRSGCFDDARVTLAFWCHKHETEEEFEARKNLPILEREAWLAWMAKL